MGQGKRFLSLLLALVFCLSLMPVSVWAEEDAQPVPVQEEALLAEEEALPAEETAEPEEAPAEEPAAETEEPAEEPAADAEAAPIEEPAAEVEETPAEELAVETEEAALEGEPAVLTVAPGSASFFRLPNGDDRALTFFALPDDTYAAFVPAGSGLSIPVTATLNGEDVTDDAAFVWDASVPQRNEEGQWKLVPVDGFEFSGQTFSTMDFGEVLESSLVLHCLATLGDSEAECRVEICVPWAEHGDGAALEPGDSGEYVLSAQTGSEDTLRAAAEPYPDDVSAAYRWFYIDGEPEDLSCEESSLPVYITEDGARYRCEMTFSYGGQAQVVDLVIRVDTSGQDQSVLQVDYADGYDYSMFADEPGDSVTLKVRATPAEAVSGYQWYRQDRFETEDGMRYDDVALEGETSDTLTVEDVRGYAEYFCRATDTNGMTENCWFRVGVQNHLDIRPDNENEDWTFRAPYGGSVTLKASVTADDMEGVALQWCRLLWQGDNIWTDELIEGATGYTLEVRDVTEHQEFMLKVTDKYGTEENRWFYATVENHLSVIPADGWYDVVLPSDGALLAVTVRADDTADLSYAWSRGYGGPGDSLSDSASLRVTEPGEYVCQVTDRYGSTEECRFNVYAPEDVPEEQPHWFVTTEALESIIEEYGNPENDSWAKYRGRTTFVFDPAGEAGEDGFRTVTVPEEFRVEINDYGVSAVIPAGVKVVVEGRLEVGGRLTVEDGGKLVVTPSGTVNVGRSLEVRGENGADFQTDEEGGRSAELWQNIDVRTEQQLRDAVAGTMTDDWPSYQKLSINVSENIRLDRGDLDLGDRADLHIPSWWYWGTSDEDPEEPIRVFERRTLTVPAGVTLTVRRGLDVQGILSVAGTLQNYGWINVNVENGGFIEFAEGAVCEAYSSIELNTGRVALEGVDGIGGEEYRNAALAFGLRGLDLSGFRVGARNNNNDGDGYWVQSIDESHMFRSAAELQDILASGLPEDERWAEYIGGDFVFDLPEGEESYTYFLPEGWDIDFDAADSIVIDEGVTVVLCEDADWNAPLTVNGILELRTELRTGEEVTVDDLSHFRIVGGYDQMSRLTITKRLRTGDDLTDAIDWANGWQSWLKSEEVSATWPAGNTRLSDGITLRIGIQGQVSLSQSREIGRFTEIHIWNNWDDDGQPSQLLIPEGVTLTTPRQIGVWAGGCGGRIVVNGTLELDDANVELQDQGELIVNGTLRNNGCINIDLWNDSRAVFGEDSVYEGGGSFDVNTDREPINGIDPEEDGADMEAYKRFAVGMALSGLDILDDGDYECSPFEWNRDDGRGYHIEKLDLTHAFRDAAELRGILASGLTEGERWAEYRGDGEFVFALPDGAESYTYVLPAEWNFDFWNADCVIIPAGVTVEVRENTWLGENLVLCGNLDLYREAQIGSLLGALPIADDEPAGLGAETLDRVSFSGRDARLVIQNSAWDDEDLTAEERFGALVDTAELVQAYIDDDPTKSGRFTVRATLIGPEVYLGERYDLPDCMELDTHAWGDPNGDYDSYVFVEDLTVSRYLAARCTTLYVGRRLTVNDSLEIDRGALEMNEGARCFIGGDLSIFGGESPSASWDGDFTIPAGAVVEVNGDFAITGVLTIDDGYQKDEGEYVEPGKLIVHGEVHAEEIVGAEHIELVGDAGLWEKRWVENWNELLQAVSDAAGLTGRSGLDVSVCGDIALRESLALGDNMNVTLDSRWIEGGENDEGYWRPYTLTVPSGMTLTVGRQLRVTGALVVDGTLVNRGTIELFGDQGGYIALAGENCYRGTGQILLHGFRIWDDERHEDVDRRDALLRGIDWENTNFREDGRDDWTLFLRYDDPSHWFTDTDGLLAAIDLLGDADENERWADYAGEADPFVFADNADLVIPDSFNVNFPGSVTIPAGVTVTVAGRLYLGELTVAAGGTLRVIDNGEVHCGGLTVSGTLSIDMNGTAVWLERDVRTETELRQALADAEELTDEYCLGVNVVADIDVTSNLRVGQHADLRIERNETEHGFEPYTLTVKSGAALTVDRYLGVDGTLVVENGAALQNNNRIEVWAESGSIRLDGDYDGFGRLQVCELDRDDVSVEAALDGFDLRGFYRESEDDWQITFCKLDPDGQFTDLSELPAIIARAEADPHGMYDYELRWGGAMPPTFEEDITIPANLRINLRGSAFIAPGVTVTVCGSLLASWLELQAENGGHGTLVVGEKGFVGLDGEIEGDSLETASLVQIDAENHGLIRYHFTAESEQKFYVTMAVLPVIAEQAAASGSQIWVGLTENVDFYDENGLTIPQNAILELRTDWYDDHPHIGRLNVHGTLENHGHIRIETNGENTLTAESYAGFGSIEVCCLDNAPIESPWDVLLGGFEHDDFFVDPFRDGNGWYLEKIDPAYTFTNTDELLALLVELDETPENEWVKLTYTGESPFTIDKDVTILAGYSVDINGDVIVPAGVTLSIEASTDEDAAVWLPGGEFSVDGNMTVRGEVDNGFFLVIHYYHNGRLILDGGTVTGDGAICALTGSWTRPTSEDLGFDLSDYAMHSYPAPGNIPAWQICKPYDWFLSFDELAYIAEHMAADEERDVYYALSDNPFTFEEDIVLPAGLHLKDMDGSEITIPAGVTVTAEDELAVRSLQVDGGLAVYGGRVTVTQELENNGEIRVGIRDGDTVGRITLTDGAAYTGEGRVMIQKTPAAAGFTGWESSSYSVSQTEYLGETWDVYTCVETYGVETVIHNEKTANGVTTATLSDVKTEIILDGIVNETTVVDGNTMQNVQDALSNETLVITTQVNVTELPPDPQNVDAVKDRYGQNCEVLQAMDLTVNLVATDGENETMLGTVSKTAEPIRFTFVLTDDQLGQIGNNGVFIDQNHNGVRRRLPASLRGNLLSFKGDLFSTYSIVTDGAGVRYDLGDVNGDTRVNTADLLRLLKRTVDLNVTTYGELDLNGDGTAANSADLLHLLKYVNGLLKTLV